MIAGRKEYTHLQNVCARSIIQLTTDECYISNDSFWLGGDCGMVYVQECDGCTGYDSSEKTLKGNYDVIWEERSIARHALLKGRDLENELAQVSGGLLRSHVRLGQPCVERPSFVLFELLYERVLHLCEEGRVEFIPFSRLQIGLL